MYLGGFPSSGPEAVREWAGLGRGHHGGRSTESRAGTENDLTCTSHHSPWALSSKDQLLLSSKKVDPGPVSAMNVWGGVALE